MASVVTLRRHDTTRKVALYAPADHIAVLRETGLDSLFDVLEVIPEAHRSIVGFKHYLERFMPFDRCLFVDADMVWCRDPGPLWRMLSAYDFTATGIHRSDFWFGGPKGLPVLVDYFLDRRRRTMERFGLTWLPRIQAGMLYASDRDLAGRVCGTARSFLERRSETHFRSRLKEGRSEESCEWSLAMAMSAHDLPVLPWFQGQYSPQLDYVAGLVDHDPEFEHVSCTYYTERSIHDLRGIPSAGMRASMIRFFSRMPGHGDRMQVTPFALHFGWLRYKQPFMDFADRIWTRLSSTSRAGELPPHAGNGHHQAAEPASAR